MRTFENRVRRNTFTPTGKEGYHYSSQNIVRVNTSRPIRRVKGTVHHGGGGGGGIACRVCANP